ncbi:MAG TPA: cytochrome bc complex cytochrome b subunit [Melioribacteraceae bacterium]|nr:cytochrome bc complex cytochrome b subunit [Melioribacteraceae bacterium]
MKKRIDSWLKERIPFNREKSSHIIKEVLLKEPIPKHMKNWFYALGATPLVLFLFQLVTGVFLTFYYVPSPEGAYESVRHITQDVEFGFWIRGLHRWASNFMVIAMMLHVVRVFFTRGYRKPRELNWIVGILMLVTTLGLCFTGYSLLFNQLSYWAATVGTNMIKEVPLIGSSILELLRGGTDVSGNTLTRFYNLHIVFLPAVLLILIVIHIIMVRLHGVSKLEGYETTEESYPFYPEHFYHTLVISLFLLITISALTVILPPGLGEEANPAVTPPHIKPEWYFFAVYSILKILPLRLGIYLSIAVLIAATFWPFIEDYILRKWPGIKANYWIGSIIILLFLFFTLYEIIVI